MTSKQMKTWDAIYQFWQTEDGQLYSQHMGLLIRCKDCKYSVDEYGDNECYCRNRLNGTYLMYIKDWDHYCSWAERKEENE